MHVHGRLVGKLVTIIHHSVLGINLLHSYFKLVETWLHAMQASFKLYNKNVNHIFKEHTNLVTCNCF